jgi:hypothetical protein
MFRELFEAKYRCASASPVTARGQRTPCKTSQKALLFRAFWLILIPLLSISSASSLYAEAPATPAALPNAPGVQQASDPAQATPGTAVITGTLEDPSGKPLPNAPLRIYGSGLVEAIAGSTDAGGNFRITGLHAGTYHVQASARGFLTATSPLVVLGKGEVYRLSITEIPLPKSTTTVKVYASTLQLATQQVHQEEKQRVLGLVPNFFTSYQPNPAPLNAKLKMKLTFRTMADPFIFGVAAAVAGLEQQQNIYPGYGTGWSGYGKRFGAAYADSNISRFFGEGLYPSLFRQDPRYFYKGTGSFPSRLWYAIRSSFVAKGDNGNWQPGYSEIAGDFTAAGISNLYHAPQDRSFSTTMRDGGILIGGDALENILREFLSKSLTTNLPPNAK